MTSAFKYTQVFNNAGSMFLFIQCSQFARAFTTICYVADSAHLLLMRKLNREHELRTAVANWSPCLSRSPEFVVFQLIPFSSPFPPCLVLPMTVSHVASHKRELQAYECKCDRMSSLILWGLVRCINKCSYESSTVPEHCLQGRRCSPFIMTTGIICYEC